MKINTLKILTLSVLLPAMAASATACIVSVDDGDDTGTGDGDACDSCLESECSSEITACDSDTNCVCWLNCLGNGGDQTSCQTECGAPEQTFLDTVTCIQGAAQGACAEVCV